MDSLWNILSRFLNGWGCIVLFFLLAACTTYVMIVGWKW